jgi:hypothetical protein
MLHPESTAYDLFDGKTYPLAEMPTEMSSEAKATLGDVKKDVDQRLPAMALVAGVESGEDRMAFPVNEKVERACFRAAVGDVPVAVFWYGPTKSAVAFRAELDGQALTFYADDISPETAPFKDKETGTRWTLAGRGVDGPMRGKELTWVNSIQCRWYAWVAENSKSRVFEESPGK